MEPGELARKENTAEIRAFNLKRKLHDFKISYHDARSPESTPPIDSTPMFKLPVEIVLAISKHLPLISKACLALTCKGLYRMFADVLASSNLQFPLEGTVNRLLKNVCLAVGPWRLIRLLEDSRGWLACSLCLKLHPFSYFTPRQILFKKPDSRVCRSGYCTGFVNICPCKNFTVRNKCEIVDELRQMHKVPLWERYDRGVWHRCLSRWGDVLMRSEITPYLSPHDDLIFRVENVSTWEDQSSAVNERLQWMCPHGLEQHFRYTPCTWDRNSQGNPPLSVTGLPLRRYSAESTCEECGTKVRSVISEERNDEYTRRCVGIRNLGNARGIPDQKWHYQAAYSPSGRLKNTRSPRGHSLPNSYCPPREPLFTRLKARFRRT